jgi:hypothetical protein
MTWTEVSVGPTTTDGTEQTIVSSTTTNGTYLFDINCENMALGDAIEIRIKTKIDSSDTSDAVQYATYANVQYPEKKVSDPIAVGNGEIIVTLKRVGGSDRSYRWTLKRI